MPQELRMTDLNYAKGLLESKGPTEMYDFLASKGYKYATLANGVAKRNSVAGDVSVHYMKSVAEELGRPMSDGDVDKVFYQMAEAYVDVLITKLDKVTGILK